MCQAKPGVRCAADTRAQARQALDAYQAAFPDGPAVDPLSASAALVTAANHDVAVLEQQVADASAVLAPLNEARAAASRAMSAARDASAQAYAQANAAGEEALNRIHELYLAAGVSPRMADYYVGDVREAAGLGDMRRVGAGMMPFVNDEDRWTSVAEGRAPFVKVKASGPDAAATSAASEAARGDAALTAALARHADARRQLSHSFIAHERATRVFDDAVRAASPSVRTRSDLERRLDSARGDARVMRARAAAGLDLRGRAALASTITADDFVVNPDGTTNLWVREEGGERPTYEQVTAIVDASGGKMLQTSSGRLVSTQTTPRDRRDVSLWIDPPAADAVRASEVVQRLVLNDAYGIS